MNLSFWSKSQNKYSFVSLIHVNLATALTILSSLVKSNWSCFHFKHLAQNVQNCPKCVRTLCTFKLRFTRHNIGYIFFFSPLQVLLPLRHLLPTCTTPFSLVWLIRPRSWTVPRPSRPSWLPSRKMTVWQILDMLSRYSKELGIKKQVSIWSGVLMKEKTSLLLRTSPHSNNMLVYEP